MTSTLRDRTRTSPRRASGPRATIASRWRGLEPRERALLVLAVVVLSILPLAISLARPSVRWSELVVAQASGGAAPRGTLVEHVTELLRDDGFRASLAADRDSTWFAYESRLDEVEVSAAEKDPSRARVRVPARTRREAFDTARSMAALITSQGRAAPMMVAAGRDRLREIDLALRDTPLASSRRRGLLAERRFIRAAIANVVPLEVVDPPSAPSRSTAEALIEKVDESGAPRPNPLWAGLAGLMLGLALCCLRLARRPGEEADRASRRPGSR